MTRQLSLMHKHFGRDHVNKCGACRNFASGQYHGRKLQKCERYGISHSAATDWAQRWQGCGKFNIPLGEYERPLKEWIGLRVNDNSPIDGQMEMLEI